MNFTPSTRSTRFHFSALIARIEKACNWAQIDQGRATRYARLIREFFDGHGNSEGGVLAYHEANEIAEIYELWSTKVDEFPGLKDRMSEAFTSGALIADHENLATSSNRPRNDSFVYFVAGRLLVSGCEVLTVDGINRIGEHGQWVGDITIKHDGMILDVQCKRPRSPDAIGRNVTKARKQILNAVSPGRGFIALDVSVIVRPKGTLLEANSVSGASDMLSRLIQPHAESVDRALNFSGRLGDKISKVHKEIAGLIWFASLPCMIKEPSQIIKPLGDRYKITRPYSATEVAISLNDTSPHRSALLRIGERLKCWLEDKWT